MINKEVLYYDATENERKYLDALCAIDDLLNEDFDVPEFSVENLRAITEVSLRQSYKVVAGVGKIVDDVLQTEYNDEDTGE